MISKKYKISICTVCMNRLHHLKETLLKNIDDNDDYDNIEFVVLDYNSSDGMDEWVRENMREHLSSGKMNYYRVNEPQSWNPSHSKNIAFKLATGDILCNIWSDYYAGKGFARYTNAEFSNDKNIVLTPIDFHKSKPEFYAPPDTLGKVCVAKADFLKVNGFDERMDRHGFEDYDFINRLEFAGVKRVLIDDVAFLRYIGHSDAERYHIAEPDSFEVFANYISPWMSECIILHKNQLFEKATFLDESTIEANNCYYATHLRTNRFTYTLKDGKWESGSWKPARGQKIVFGSKQYKGPVYQKDVQQNKNVLIETNTDKVYYQVTDQEGIKGFMNFKHFYKTRSLMEDNMKEKIIRANPQHFGKAMVYKNFASQPIYI